MVNNDENVDTKSNCERVEPNEVFEISIKVEGNESELLNGTSTNGIKLGSENVTGEFYESIDETLSSNVSKKTVASTKHVDGIHIPQDITNQPDETQVGPDEHIAVEIAPITEGFGPDNPIVDVSIYDKENDNSKNEIRKKCKKHKHRHRKKSMHRRDHENNSTSEIKSSHHKKSHGILKKENSSRSDFRDSKKRGRPCKHKKARTDISVDLVESLEDNDSETKVNGSPDLISQTIDSVLKTEYDDDLPKKISFKVPGRKRGRPPKIKVPPLDEDNSVVIEGNELVAKLEPRKGRGRPRKFKLDSEMHESDNEEKPSKKRGRKKMIQIIEMGSGEDAPMIYGCSICSYTTSKRMYVAQHHYRVHKTVTQFQCPHCSYTGKIRSALVNHMKIHSGVKPLKCSFCDYATCERTNLAVHMSRHTGIKKFKCPHCDYSAMRIGRIQMHMSIHTGLKMLKCDVCGHGFNTNAKLKEHRRIHTGEKPFKCDECDYSCRMATQLKTHKHVHVGSPYVCKFCGDGFSAKASLLQHEERHEDPDERLSPTKKRPKVYTCLHCEFCTSTSLLLESHTRKKHRVAWKCSICNIQFNSAEEFAKHSEEHGSEENDTRPNYKCGFCEEQFESVDVLTEHFSAHIVGESYKCLQCDFTANTHKALKEHIHKQSGTVYKCSECDYKSYHLDHVTYHLKSHTGPIKVYSCIHCDFRSRDLEVFNTHKCFESDGDSKVVELSVDECL